MEIKIKRELNPFYETAVLLLTARHAEQVKQECIDQLNIMGLDGAAFYRDNLQVWDKYMRVFGASCDFRQEDELFFEDEDPQWQGLLQAMVAEGTALWKKGGATQQDWERLMVQLLEEESGTEIPVTAQEKIEFLQKQSIDSNAKWKALLILENPKERIEQIFAACERNQQAYEKARKSVEKQIDHLMQLCPDHAEPRFASVVGAFTEVSQVFVSMVTPMLFWAGNTTGVYGLLVDRIFNYGSEQNQQKEWIQAQLKTISDKSKFEILSLLKEKSKYNLEIAEQLGLTPATVSHHMNQLLNMDLVTVEKKKGKVYYHSSMEELERVVQRMREHLL